MFYVLLYVTYVHSSFAALLSLPSWRLVIVVWLCLAVPWVCLQFVIVVLDLGRLELLFYTHFVYVLLSDFINLTQVHNFTVCAQVIFTFRRLSVFTVSFTRILQVVMQIMNCFALNY